MQQADWAGPIGDVWAQEWRRTDRSFAGLDPSLDAAILDAAPSAAFRALDIGCGAGTTSLSLAGARVDARITGIDISPGLVAIAEARSEAVDRVDFVVGDAARVAADHGPAELLFSRHGVMFFDDPVAAFSTLRAAARPGARLVFSCFRAAGLNAWARTLIDAVGGGSPEAPGTPGPFAFADADRVRDILNASGWRDGRSDAVDFAYRAGEGPDPIADAVSFFSRIGPTARLMNMASPADAPAMRARLTAALSAQVTHGVIDFDAAAWIWSATAAQEPT